MEEQETAITNTMSLPIPVDREIDRVIAEIRTAWPYMKTDAVLGIERACKNMILNVVDTQGQAMEEAKSRISFMTLPPELRNRIYQLTLLPSKGDSGCVDNTTAIDLKTPNSTWTRHPALTKVSRQIRAESLPLYYGLNKFVVRISQTRSYRSTVKQCSFGKSLSSDCAAVWLSRIGKANIDLIKDLEIRHIRAIGPVGIGSVGETFTHDWNEFAKAIGYPHVPSAKHMAIFLDQNLIDECGTSHTFESLWVPICFE